MDEGAKKHINTKKTRENIGIDATVHGLSTPMVSRRLARAFSKLPVQTWFDPKPRAWGQHQSHFFAPKKGKEWQDIAPFHGKKPKTTFLWPRNRLKNNENIYI
jgi:hypothetical protein